LYYAALGGLLCILDCLLNRDFGINAQGGFYSNALQTALYEGHEQIVQLLVEKGANVNAQGGRYGNALQAVSYRGHEQIVRLLVNKGANQPF
jgi:ankyrin repeat protein